MGTGTSCGAAVALAVEHQRCRFNSQVLQSVGVLRQETEPPINPDGCAIAL